MKHVLFAIATCLVFTLTTTNTFGQTKAKKQGVKTKQGTLTQPKGGSIYRDSLPFVKKTDPARIAKNGNQGVRAGSQSGRKLQQKPAAPGSIWDSIPPQVKGGKAMPKLQNQSNPNGSVAKSKNAHSNLQRGQGNRNVQDPKMRQRQANSTQRTSKQSAQNRKKTKRNNY